MTLLWLLIAVAVRIGLLMLEIDCDKDGFHLTFIVRRK